MMNHFSIVSQGYNISEVNEFVDEVIQKIEALSQQNNAYLEQIQALKKDSHRSIDVQVSNALVAAMETTDKMKEIARSEASLIVKEARDNASAIVEEALIEAQKTRQEYELLKKNCNVYRIKMENLAKAQLELCKDINEEN